MLLFSAINIIIFQDFQFKKQFHHGILDCLHKEEVELLGRLSNFVLSLKVICRKLVARKQRLKGL